MRNANPRTSPRISPNRVELLLLLTGERIGLPEAEEGQEVEKEVGQLVSTKQLEKEGHQPQRGLFDEVQFSQVEIQSKKFLVAVIE